MIRNIPTTLLLLLCACTPTLWGKQGASAIDLERDLDACRAELPLAEASYSEAFAARGQARAITNMQDDPAMYSMYRANLMRLCLLSRGYRQVDMQELSARQESLPAPPSGDSP